MWKRQMAWRGTRKDSGKERKIQTKGMVSSQHRLEGNSQNTGGKLKMVNLVGVTGKGAGKGSTAPEATEHSHTGRKEYCPLDSTTKTLFMTSVKAVSGLLST